MHKWAVPLVAEVSHGPQVINYIGVLIYNTMCIKPILSPLDDMAYIKNDTEVTIKII